MRAILIGVFVANLVLTAISLAVLPEQVAIHFSAGGTPDSWASREFNATIFLVLQVPFFLMFYFAPRLLLGTPRSLWNIPNKEYWFQSENQATMHRKFGNVMTEFGIALFVFFFCISFLAMRANLSDPVRLDERTFLIFLVLYLAYTLWWVVKVMRTFRFPKGQDGKTAS